MRIDDNACNSSSIIHAIFSIYFYSCTSLHVIQICNYELYFHITCLYTHVNLLSILFPIKSQGLTIYILYFCFGTSVLCSAVICMSSTQGDAKNKTKSVLGASEGTKEKKTSALWSSWTSISFEPTHAPSHFVCPSKCFLGQQMRWRNTPDL